MNHLKRARAAFVGAAMSFVACGGKDFASGNDQTGASGGNRNQAGMTSASGGSNGASAGAQAGGDRGGVGAAGAGKGGGAQEPGDAAAGAAGAATTCDPRAPFGTPALVLGGVNSIDDELSPRLSLDERSLYFARRAASDLAGPSDLYAATRGSLGDPFDLAAPLAINTDTSDADPMLSQDGQTLFFSSDRPNGMGELDLYQASRALTSLPFTSASPVPDLNTAGSEAQPFATSDGELWFVYRRPGANSAFHLRRAPRAGAGYSGAVAVMELDSTTEDSWPVLSVDKKTIYYSSQRTDGGAKGKADIWRAQRSSASGAFDPPTNAGELNSPATDYPGWISADDCRLYLASNRSPTRGYEIYVATRALAP